MIRNSPLANSLVLSDTAVPGRRRVTVLLARVHSSECLLTHLFARVRWRKEDADVLLGRGLRRANRADDVGGPPVHVRSALWSRRCEDNPSRHRRTSESNRLSDEAPDREPKDVDLFEVH